MAISIDEIKKHATDGPTAWNRYVGLMWQHLFEKFELPKHGTFVEVAPGTEEKVGSGLSGYGFSGRLYVVEPVQDVSDRICQKYRQSMAAEVIPLCTTLAGATKLLSERGETIDFLVANHPLDDMAMAQTLNEPGMVDFFKEHYAVDADQRREEWRRFEFFAVDAKAKTFAEWATAIRALEPRVTIISQYESYYFRDHGILGPDRHAYDILKQLERNFSGLVDKSANGDLAQLETNPDRWLVLRNK